MQQPKEKTQIEEAAIQSLADLQSRMTEVSKESNQFSDKFLFGGTVAIVALLNTDLLIDKSIILLPPTVGAMSLFIVLSIVVFMLSWVYFRGVAKRIKTFDLAYRRTKHKYEILQYGLLLGCDTKELLSEMEKKAKPNSEGSQSFPEGGDFRAIAAYLHDHHGRKFEERQEDLSEPRLAMYIVLLTVVIKFLMYVMVANSGAA
jgi:hypothetical protein